MSEDTYKALPAVILISALLVCISIGVVCITKYGVPSVPSAQLDRLGPTFLFGRPREYTTESLRYVASRNRPLIQTPTEPLQLPQPLQPLPVTSPVTENPPHILYPEVPNNQI